MIFWILSILTSFTSFGRALANTVSQMEVFHEVIKRLELTSYSLSKCEPLDTLVKIELPNDVGHVEKFIPSHVLIPRCSGLQADS